MPLIRHRREVPRGNIAPFLSQVDVLCARQQPKVPFQCTHRSQSPIKSEGVGPSNFVDEASHKGIVVDVLVDTPLCFCVSLLVFVFFSFVMYLHRQTGCPRSQEVSSRGLEWWSTSSRQLYAGPTPPGGRPRSPRRCWNLIDRLVHSPLVALIHIINAETVFVFQLRQGHAHSLQQTLFFEAPLFPHATDFSRFCAPPVAVTDTEPGEGCVRRGDHAPVSPTEAEQVKVKSARTSLLNRS